MRVISGEFKGRQLTALTGVALRPTSDRVREALFSIIGHEIVGARVADLYAGTGAIGIEALSRGAEHVTFVESNPKVLRLLRRNLAQCGLEPRSAVVKCSVGQFLRRRPHHVGAYDLVFADPPYHSEAAEEFLRSLVASVTIGPDALVVLEHSTKTKTFTPIEALPLRRQYRYGDTTLSVFTSETGRTSVQ